MDFREEVKGRGARFGIEEKEYIILRALGRPTVVMRLQSSKLNVVVGS